MFSVYCCPVDDLLRTDAGELGTSGELVTVLSRSMSAILNLDTGSQKHTTCIPSNDCDICKQCTQTHTILIQGVYVRSPIITINALILIITSRDI